MSMVTSGRTQMNHQMNQITCQCQTCRVCMHIYIEIIYVCVFICSNVRCKYLIRKKQVRLIWHSMSQHHHFIDRRSSTESSFTRNESQWYAIINQMDQEDFWISEYKEHVQLPCDPMLIHNDYGVMGRVVQTPWFGPLTHGSWLRSCKYSTPVWLKSEPEPSVFPTFSEYIHVACTDKCERILSEWRSSSHLCSRKNIVELSTSARHPSQ